jgi:hypothetical protein
MNNTLEFPRLLRLMRKQGIENFSFYGMAALAIAGIMATMFTLWILASGNNFHEEPVYIIYFVGLFLAGCILASTAFSIFSDKARGGFWLALPASHLEKLITVIVFNTIVFFLVYSGCFLLLKPLAIAYINNKVLAEPNTFHFQRLSWSNGRGDGFREVFNAFLYVFFALQALYLMGSAFFSKHAFIKTTIIGAAFLFLLFVYIYNMSTWLIPKGVNTGPVMEPSEQQEDILTWVMKLIWVPLFWVIT